MSMQIPFITIQCDWNEVVRLPNAEAWISSKEINKNSIHDKLTTSLSEGKIKINFSGNYRFASLNPLCLVVNHIESGLKVAFVAPSKCHEIHRNGIISVSVTEQAFAVSSCEGDKLRVWDSRTSEVFLDLNGHCSSVYKCRYFPSGIVILSAGADGTARIWSAESGINPVTLRGHTMAVTDICILDLGKNVISVSKDGTAKLWDVGKSNCLANILEELGQINSCAISITSDEIEVKNEREVGTGDKLLLVGCESGLVVGVHVAKREIVFSKHLDAACNAVAGLYKTIVAGCSNGKVVLINPHNGSILREWHESASPVLCVARLPSHKFIVGRQDGTCTVMSIQDYFKKVRVQLTGSDCDGIRDVCFNGKWIFTGCRDAVIRKYDLNQINVHFK